MPDHAHMFISIPPKYAVSQAAGFIIAGEYFGRKKNFTGQHFWAGGCHVSTAGGDEETIRRYIRKEEQEDRRIDQIDLFKQCPSGNEDFCSRSRHAKKITAGIYLIFRGLFFEPDAEIAENSHSRTASYGLNTGSFQENGENKNTSPFLYTRTDRVYFSFYSMIDLIIPDALSHSMIT